MKFRIALICGLALFLASSPSSASAGTSSRIAFAGGGLNFISPTGKELGTIKLFGYTTALSASDNGRHVAVLRHDGTDGAHGEFYSLFVWTAGQRKLRRVEIGGPIPTAGAPSLSISPDGDLLAFSAGFTIRIINLGAERHWTLRKPRGFDFQASFTSDGRHLVFVHSTCYPGECGSKSDKSDIFTMTIHGKSRHRLTETLGEELFPVISPDGKQLAFLRRNPRGFELVTRPIASDHEQVIRQVKCPFSRPDFSPDGTRIVYALSKDSECFGFQRTTILTVGVNGRGSHAVASGIGLLLPQWMRSPSR